VRLRSGGEEDRDAELGAFRPERVDDLGVRQRIGYRPAVLWFIVASERSGRRTRRPASRSPRRPAASDLVNQVEIGVEERAARLLAHDVWVPDALEERPRMVER
jgi:hypothetical protein